MWLRPSEVKDKLTVMNSYTFNQSNVTLKLFRDAVGYQVWLYNNHSMDMYALWGFDDLSLADYAYVRTIGWIQNQECVECGAERAKLSLIYPEFPMECVMVGYESE